jgi:hypothetical protein
MEVGKLKLPHLRQDTSMSSDGSADRSACNFGFILEPPEEGVLFLLRM